MPQSSKRSECLRNLRKMLCLREFRMSHQSFDSLLSLIQNHPVFYSNSNVPQQPVRDQLMKGPLSCIAIVWWRQFWLLKGQLVLIKSTNVLCFFLGPTVMNNPQSMLRTTTQGKDRMGWLPLLYATAINE
ncbi:hypothetical protein VP01_1292g2 [Puccinia sorghi]|uniref:Uncharacterized protein n=1 Tax=Puccinia sorghi TaxID=27349 RepID=A0A0L6VNB7_9BASI|nr:hypothetical protein VP01_1292g2 [Puccinia sorghi]